ncbi:hypothetical protein NYG90_01715 [Helicobacter sp. XJK30-2]|uniref:Uncharacterized protein n=1 Tax=Helicobacter zhangjianzhongii TaxID=2974574 RepID=A0ACC6FQ94_9HELI|nr:hypothetical protein [Helicobacter sp. XJK30-2]MDL0081408.1 hypothetical protein [Helicobacter sp. XJK30-2]
MQGEAEAGFFRKQAKRCKAKPKQVSLENKGHRSPLGDVSLEKPNPFEKSGF